MVIENLLIMATFSGLSAVIIQAKIRQDKKLRTMQLKKRFVFYSIELLVGVLAGILMYCLALPVSVERVILLGIVSGVSAHSILENSFGYLSSQKVDAIKGIKETQFNQIGEDE